MKSKFEGMDNEPVMRDFRLCLKHEVNRRGRRKPGKLRFQETQAELEQKLKKKNESEEEERRVNRLINDISIIRSELSRVQHGYKSERSNWVQKTSKLQQQLNEMDGAVKDGKEHLHKKEQKYKHEMKMLKSQNKELNDILRKERNERPYEDAQTQKALEDLVFELYTMKKELTELRTRYKDERTRWKIANDDLDKRVRLLLSQSEGDEAALAESTMFYYQQFDQMKKENFCLKEELEEEKKKNKALEIQVDVLREEVMRTTTEGDDLDHNQTKTLDESAPETAPVRSKPPSMRHLAKMKSLEVEDDAEPIRHKNYEENLIHRAELEAQQEKSNAMSEKITNLEKENKDIQMQLSHTKDDLKSMNENNSRLGQELESVRSKNLDVMGTCKTQEKELDILNRERTDLEQESQRLKDEAAMRKKELKELKDEMVRRTEELDDIHRQHMEEKRKRSQHETVLEEENRRATAEIQKLRDELEDMRQNEKLTKEKIAALKNRITSSKENCDKLRSDFRELESIV